MKSGSLDETSLAILRHLARLRLSFTEVIRSVACKGVDPESRLRSLKQTGHIDAVSGRYGGSRVAYVLKPAGAAAAGAGRRRGDPAGTQAEQRNLAVFCYCMLCKRQRTRLNEDELQAVFADTDLPEGAYSLEYGPRTKRVELLYVPGPSTPPGEVARHVRDRVGKLQALEPLRPWLVNGVLAIAALVDDADRQALIKTAVDEQELEDRPLHTYADVNVALVPRRESLSEALRVFT